MTNDDDLIRLLRSALPPVDSVTPSRDLWPAIVERGHTRARFSPADLSVAAMIAVVLLMFPKWFWFLAYHL